MLNNMEPILTAGTPDNGIDATHLSRQFLAEKLRNRPFPKWKNQPEYDTAGSRSIHHRYSVVSHSSLTEHEHSTEALLHP